MSFFPLKNILLNGSQIYHMYTWHKKEKARRHNIMFCDLETILLKDINSDNIFCFPSHLLQIQKHFHLYIFHSQVDDSKCIFSINMYMYINDLLIT